jgi:hypothetical protein
MDLNITLLLWGGLVGIVFSVIGAAGGILASFGLINLVGISEPIVCQIQYLVDKWVQD